MPKTIRVWTDEEILFLELNYKTMCQTDIADKLNRSKVSVGHKLMRLGLKIGSKEHLRRACRTLLAINEKHTGSYNPNWKGGVSLEPGRYARRFRKKFPEKARAHRLVYYHVKRGNLRRLPCSICGEVKTFAHHKDYAKPLDVVWLCRKHHVEQHKKEKT